MEHNLESTIALLARTPSVLDALLRDLPEVWTHSKEGPNTWSATDVVAHLVHCEHDDWLPKAKVILQAGGDHTFPPFDRDGHARYSQGKTLGQLLNELTQVRSRSLEELRALNLTPKDLERRGRHPALGEVTLSQLLATWAAHDMTHLHQISRIIAHQYGEAVGPWARFLGVMQCAGHSASS